jgi:hypothetical protein
MTLDDLYFLYDWMEAYDGEESPKNSAAQTRILAWADREIARRRRDALVRSTAKLHNVSIARANRALRKIGR